MHTTVQEQHASIDDRPADGGDCNGCSDYCSNYCSNYSDSSDSRIAEREHATVLRRAAMDFLARREHSRFELGQKLQRRFPDVAAALIDSVTAALHDEGLQSDARFVESYVRYRKQRGFGYHHIRRDLMQRQAAEPLIARHLQPDDPDWPTILQSHITRRLGNKATPATLEFGSREHQRIVRFLTNRGFPIGDIIKALQPHLCQPQKTWPTASQVIRTKPDNLDNTEQTLVE